MKSRRTIGLATALLAGISLSANCVLAAPRDIPVKSGEPWKHKPSGVVVPFSSDGFERTAVQDVSASESDVIAMYSDPTSKSVATIFVFRAGIVDASLWQDRILQTVGSFPEKYGMVDPASRISTPFTPQNGTTNSGSLVVVGMSGKGFSASGSVTLPLDHWLVAVRMTSQTLDPRSLDVRLTQFVSRLTLPKPRRQALPAYEISPCSWSLPTADAERSTDGMMDGLLGAMVGQLLQKHENDRPAARTETNNEDLHFCLLQDGGASLDAYAHDREHSGYVVATGDAGVIVDIGTSNLASVLKMDKAAAVMMTLQTTEKSLSFRGFKTLPPLSQVVRVINNERPISAIDRTGKKPGNIKIMTPPK